MERCSRLRKLKSRNLLESETKRRIKLILSNSTDILRERLDNGLILVLSQDTTVFDDYYQTYAKEISSIYASEKSFESLERKDLDSKLVRKNLQCHNVDNDWLCIVLDYDCPYLGRKSKSNIKKEVSEIIDFDKNCMSIIIEEKNGIINFYYWLRLTKNNMVDNDDNIWVKSKTLDFKNDDLFLEQVQNQMYLTFRYKLTKTEILNNFDEIMEMFKIDSY